MSGGGRSRPRADAGAAVSWVGRELELTVGAVAHGGHCVARVGGAGGRVVFVRHALPGETVRAVVTEDGGGAFCRADAVTVLSASPLRVPPPCPHAGPGRCGGCDWQHATAEAQRELKAAVVREQFARLARLEVEVSVEPLPGGSLGWRTRTQYSVRADGVVGLRRHRSHDVEPLTECPLGRPGVGDAPELRQRWPGSAELTVATGTDGARTVLVRAGADRARGRRPAALRVVSGPPRLTHRVDQITHRVRADGFWQVHPAMAATLVSLVTDQLAPRPGDRVLDLYAGAGLFTAALAEVVGPTGSVVGLESDPDAVSDAGPTLAARPWAEVRRARVNAATVAALGPADLIVLDPPRAGAGRETMHAVLAGGARAISYVACDPAALARDVRTALDAGWALAQLRALDAFPMTQHIECVALLTPPPG